MRANQVKRLKELEHQNATLKNLVAGLSQDNAFLKEANRGNVRGRLKYAELQTTCVMSWRYRNDALVRC
jgi:hypothetical protein